MILFSSWKMEDVEDVLFKKYCYLCTTGVNIIYIKAYDEVCDYSL